jgi:hypothetical protein
MIENLRERKRKNDNRTKKCDKEIEKREKER